MRILPSSVAAARETIAEGVDLVVLTGSVASGRDVLAQCAATLTPTIMELSGSDAVLVGPGADLERVARALRWGRALNHGHTCMVPQRVLVDPACAFDGEVVPVDQMAEVVEQSRSWPRS